MRKSKLKTPGQPVLTGQRLGFSLGRSLRPWAIAAVLLTLAGGTLGLLHADEDTMESLTRKLWPGERTAAALQAVEQQRQNGLLTEEAYQRRKKPLQDRLAGTFTPTALSLTNQASNFIQNGGFEQVNRNSNPNRCRWLWWGGWDWGGSYVNMWEERPEHVHAGKFSARVECKGEKGRIGISTPPLPLIPGATEYKLSLWAKGTAGNELFVNFEEGATGTLRETLPAEWKQLTVVGKPVGGKRTYQVYLYVTGGGTLWLDDVALAPIGGNLEE